MAIALADKFKIALGNETDFSERVMVQLHREATYRANGGATGQDRVACRAVWANVTNYRFPMTLAVLNDQFVDVQSIDALNALPDLGPGSIEAAIGAQWNTFVAALFPANV